MKAILEFDLNDIDDKKEHLHAINGSRYKCCLDEIEEMTFRLLDNGQFGGGFYGSSIAIPNYDTEETTITNEQFYSFLENLHKCIGEIKENWDAN